MYSMPVTCQATMSDTSVSHLCKKVLRYLSCPSREQQKAVSRKGWAWQATEGSVP